MHILYDTNSRLETYVLIVNVASCKKNMSILYGIQLVLGY